MQNQLRQIHVQIHTSEYIVHRGNKHEVAPCIVDGTLGKWGQGEF